MGRDATVAMIERVGWLDRLNGVESNQSHGIQHSAQVFAIEYR
jgi:hypothetical protein